MLENRLDRFCLRSHPEIGVGGLNSYCSGTVSKEKRTVSKKTSILSKKTHPKVLGANVHCFQKRRNDNINKICVLVWGSGRGKCEGNLSKKAIILGNSTTIKSGKFANFMVRNQRTPNPPEFAQPCLSMSNGGHPQREGTNLGVFVPVWLVLPRCDVQICVCLICVI